MPSWDTFVATIYARISEVVAEKIFSVCYDLGHSGRLELFFKKG